MADLGIDLWCVTDLQPGMTEVSGRTCLAQAIARRLITPRGRLLDDQNYGFDLRQFLNDDIVKTDIARIASGCDAEAVKDERILQSTTTANFLSGTLTLSMLLVDGNGPFTLVLAVSSVTLAILGVT